MLAVLVVTRCHITGGCFHCKNVRYSFYICFILAQIFEMSRTKLSFLKGSESSSGHFQAHTPGTRQRRSSLKCILHTWRFRLLCLVQGYSIRDCKMRDEAGGGCILCSWLLLYLTRILWWMLLSLVMRLDADFAKRFGLIHI